MFDDVPDSIDEFAEVAAAISEIEHQHCCVHTHQLAVCDALKEHYSGNLGIAKIKNIAVTARTPKLDAILKRQAVIDQVAC